MQGHDSDKEERYLYYATFSIPECWKRGHAALAVVYHEDPEALLEEHFQLLKDSPYIH